MRTIKLFTIFRTGVIITCTTTNADFYLRTTIIFESIQFKMFSIGFEQQE